MKSLHFIVWIVPFLLMGAGFFTSKFKKFRFARLCVYVVILFLAFLLDLQSTSFVSDAADVLFSQIILITFSDILWRILRGRVKVIRIATAVTGLLLFGWWYKDWITDGPALLHLRWSTRIIERHVGAKGKYHIKEEITRKRNEEPVREFVLYKGRFAQLLEQECSSYIIPDGYEKADFFFSWREVKQEDEVQIVGDKDTLWTLSGQVVPQ